MFYLLRHGTHSNTTILILVQYSDIFFLVRYLTEYQNFYWKCPPLIFAENTEWYCAFLAASMLFNWFIFVKFSAVTFMTIGPLHGQFTATHGHQFSTALQFFSTAKFLENGRHHGHLTPLLQSTDSTRSSVARSWNCFPASTLKQFG